MSAHSNPTIAGVETTIDDGHLPDDWKTIGWFLILLLNAVKANTAGGGGGGGQPLQPSGAAHESQGQSVQSTAAAQIVPARPTRTGVAFTNEDDSITVYFGPAGVTTADGYPLKAGKSWAPTWVGAIFCIAASGAPVVSFWDEFN